jgi:AcrR family transcriptional regulator
MNLAGRDTRERVVEAAVQLFSRQGYSGTSTREIARLADITEASLFHYFPHKQDLFWAALQERIRHIRIRKEVWHLLHQPDANPAVVLPQVIELLVHLATYHQDLIRLFLVGFIEMRPATEHIYRREFGPLIQAIGNYLEQAVKRGALYEVEPAITTVSLTAGILTHELLWPLFGGAAHTNTEEAVVAHSRYWLNALMPGYSAVVPARIALGAAR